MLRAAAARSRRFRRVSGTFRSPDRPRVERAGASRFGVGRVAPQPLLSAARVDRSHDRARLHAGHGASPRPIALELARGPDAVASGWYGHEYGRRRVDDRRVSGCRRDGSDVPAHRTRRRAIPRGHRAVRRRLGRAALPPPRSGRRATAVGRDARPDPGLARPPRRRATSTLGAPRARRPLATGQITSVGDDGEPKVLVDDLEIAWSELGGLLASYEGWH